MIPGIVASNVPAAGGGDEYTTGAVHFDGATWLENASFGAADANSFTASFWAKIVDIGGGLGKSNNFFAVDPEVSGAISFKLAYSAELETFGEMYFADATFSNYGYVVNSGAPIAQWANVLVSVESNHPSGQKLAKVYLNDADITGDVTDLGASFGMSFFEKLCRVGNEFLGSQYPIIADMADFWFAPGQYMDLSVEANRRKFIDAEGKPVNLGVDGSTPTGTAPAIFFRRAPADAASTFADNLGTGGAFTTTGTLTDASTSPSD